MVKALEGSDVDSNKKPQRSGEISRDDRYVCTYASVYVCVMYVCECVLCACV